MLSNILSLFSSHASTGYSKHTATPRYRPSPAEDHYSLLASLQIAVLDPSPSTAAPSGHNAENLRKQGRLALTFALKNHAAGSGAEKVRIANELEEAIDRAWCGGADYRGRVYEVGGWIAENEGVIPKILNGEITVEEIAAGVRPTIGCGEKVVVVGAYC